MYFVAQSEIRRKLWRTSQYRLDFSQRHPVFDAIKIRLRDARLRRQQADDDEGDDSEREHGGKDIAGSLLHVHFLVAFEVCPSAKRLSSNTRVNSVKKLTRRLSLLLIKSIQNRFCRLGHGNHLLCDGIQER